MQEEGPDAITRCIGHSHVRAPAVS
jgi:hypothetical protein